MEKTVKKIVERYLLENGMGGLCHPYALCGCELADLMPCGQPDPGCEQGRRVDGCSDYCGEGCDFHIVPVAHGIGSE